MTLTVAQLWAAYCALDEQWQAAGCPDGDQKDTVHAFGDAIYARTGRRDYNGEEG